METSVGSGVATTLEQKTTYVVSGGDKNGIEPRDKVTVPALSPPLITDT